MTVVEWLIRRFAGFMAKIRQERGEVNSAAPRRAWKARN
jgi:hypothetical protein